MAVTAAAAAGFGGPAPTFTGFVATTVDAALLVEGATRGLLAFFAGHPSPADHRWLVQSGTVIVHGGASVRRWRDGLKWSDRRALGNGFDIYREMATDPEDRLTEAERVRFFHFFSAFLFLLS